MSAPIEKRAFQCKLGKDWSNLEQREVIRLYYITYKIGFLALS